MNDRGNDDRAAVLNRARELIGGAPLKDLLRQALPADLARDVIVGSGNISIGGSVTGGTVAIGHGNVQIGGSARAGADKLAQLPSELLVDLLRLVEPSDRLLEQADKLGLLPASYDAFERNIRANRPALDPAPWRQRLAALERVVGRLEWQQQPLGSCFLVGPDLVLTNHHVVHKIVAADGDGGQLVARFDYKHGNEAFSTPGLPFPCTSANWLVDHSPHSPGDLVPNDDPGASPDELDYALLRLARPAGEDTSLGSPRGWLGLDSASALEPGDPLLVLQHPLGDRLKLCFGKVLRLNTKRTRLRYDTNTEPGSSGSPCLNDALELVALHHMGDPNFSPGRAPEFNQGIPVSLIAERLQRRGVVMAPGLRFPPAAQ